MKKFFSTLSMLGLLASVVWVSSCKKDPLPEVISGFTYTIDPTDFKKVVFTSAATNAKTLAWDFGDGQTSTELNPTHTYAALGNFTVKLTATGDGGTDVSTQVVAIADPNALLTALVGDVSKTWKLLHVANANRWPYEVGPIDKSTVWWAAGKGNEEIALRYCAMNDEYTFSRDGKFKFDTKGDFFKTDSYQNGTFTCEASTAANLIGKNGEDLSTWGDGNFTFNLTPGTKPTLEVVGLGAHIGLEKVGTDLENDHQPQASVKYDIIKLDESGPVDTLIVEVDYKFAATDPNDGGYWKFTLVRYDNPNDEPPITSFKVDVAGKVATCTNNSHDADSYTWDFGDGQTSTETNPAHTYAAAGNYTIKLTGKKGNGTSSTTHDVTISAELTEADLVGGGKAWKIRKEANSIFVGPGFGNKDWWQVPLNYLDGSSTGVDDWSCITNDEFIFKSGGVYEYKTNGDARNDGFFGTPNGCWSDAQVAASPGAPFGSGVHSFTFTPASGSASGRAIITLTNGATGAAFIGFYKGYYGGENTDGTKPPNGGNSTNRYEVVSYSKDASGETLIVSVDYTAAHDGSQAWSVVLVR